MDLAPRTSAHFRRKRRAAQASASRSADTRRWASQISSGIRSNWERCSSRKPISCCQRSLSIDRIRLEVLGRDVDALEVELLLGRDDADGRTPSLDLAVLELEQPEQRPQVVAVARPEEVAVLGVALEPVDVREDRLVLRRPDDVEVVACVVALAVGHERPVGHRVVAEDALLALGGRRRLRAQREAVVHALGEVGDRADQRLAVAGAATEDDRVDRHAQRGVVVLRDVGDVGQRRGEAAVGVRPRSGVVVLAVRDRRAHPVEPAVAGRLLLGAALPPHLAGGRVVGDVGEDAVGAVADGREGVGVGGLVGVLGDAEDAVLRVHPVELAGLLLDPQPRDVVAVERHVVAVAERVGGGHHRQVGLAGGAREATADVVALPGLLVVDADEHVLLGEELLARPAVVRPLPQAVRDLAEQRVAAVGRAEVQDRALVGDGDEVALVAVGALAEVLQVAGDVDRADEVAGVLEVVDELHAHARHPDHVEHDRAGVGDLDAGGPRRERVAGGRHQVGDDVHRLALAGAAHQVVELGLHLRGGAPVVVDALVLLVARRDDRALLRAGGVLVVAAGVVAPLAGLLQLAGRDGLLEETASSEALTTSMRSAPVSSAYSFTNSRTCGLVSPASSRAASRSAIGATSHRARAVTSRVRVLGTLGHRLTGWDQPSGVVLISPGRRRSAILVQSSRAGRPAQDERL